MSNNLITHNNFDLGPGTSSSITMADATNIDITNNRISGGTFNIYFEGGNNPFGGGDTTGCDVTNNVFVDHVYGYVSGQSEALQTYSGNVTASGAPLVPSSTGHDLVVGTASATASITAEASNENLVGTASNDDLQGDAGVNRIEGLAGDDTLAGLDGSDIFVFAANFGKDVISDFQATGASHDVVEFSKTVFDDFADVLAHASQQGQDVVIDAGGGNTLTLKNTSLTALDRTDFHFA